jgi:hypothetical protein
MNNTLLQSGNRVRVTHYGPYRGMAGTIKAVEAISDDLDRESYRFYLVALDGFIHQEPIWFESQEIAIAGLFSEQLEA